MGTRTKLEIIMAENENKNVYTFNADEIFEDIPDDPENVLMNIPPEISEKMGWVEGDVLKIQIGDQGTINIEKVDKKEDSGKEEKDTNE